MISVPRAGCVRELSRIGQAATSVVPVGSPARPATLASGESCARSAGCPAAYRASSAGSAAAPDPRTSLAVPWTTRPSVSRKRIASTLMSASISDVKLRSMKPAAPVATNS